MDKQSSVNWDDVSISLERKKQKCESITRKDSFEWLWWRILLTDLRKRTSFHLKGDAIAFSLTDTEVTTTWHYNMNSAKESTAH